MNAPKAKDPASTPGANAPSPGFQAQREPGSASAIYHGPDFP